MGFASKFAAAQAGAPAYPGGPPTAGGPPAQGGYPPQPGQQQQQQQQYQAYPGAGHPPASNQTLVSYIYPMSQFPQRISGNPPSVLQPGSGDAQQFQPQQQQQQHHYSQYSSSYAQHPGGTQPGYNAPAVPPRPGSQALSVNQYSRPTSPYPPQQMQTQVSSSHTGSLIPQPNSPYGPSPTTPQQGYPPYQTQHLPQQSTYQQSNYGQAQAPSSGWSSQSAGHGPPSGQGYPPQGGLSQPPYQGGQQGYGQPQQSQQLNQNASRYKTKLLDAIAEKGLQNFYPQGHPMLDQAANRAGEQVAKLVANWGIDQEFAYDFVKLALYDIILYIDDSGSMEFEENGARIVELNRILGHVAFAASLFDDDGIQVRFMNSTEQGNGIRDEAAAHALISRIRFAGLTPMGRELQNKVLGPLVLNPARSGQLRKPVLVIIITDGQPTGESTSDISNIIKNATSELSRNPRYGKGAVAFQFAQIGNDLKARDFLAQLDQDRTIGDVIDCTSNFESESEEMSRKNPGKHFTRYHWNTKLLLGSIDSSYDKEDEGSSNAPAGNYGQSQQYGGGYPPHGQGAYPQQGGYPPQGQGGYPPQGQGGYPPQGQGGYPPQGQGGYPPQGQGGYPPQGQGGYPPQGGYQGGPPPGQYGGQHGGQQGGYAPQQYGAPQPPRY